mgnify:CR=1 FL=1
MMHIHNAKFANREFALPYFLLPSMSCAGRQTRRNENSAVVVLIIDSSDAGEEPGVDQAERGCRALTRRTCYRIGWLHEADDGAHQSRATDMSVRNQLDLIGHRGELQLFSNCAGILPTYTSFERCLVVSILSRNSRRFGKDSQAPITNWLYNELTREYIDSGQLTNALVT